MMHVNCSSLLQCYFLIIFHLFFSKFFVMRNIGIVLLIYDWNAAQEGQTYI